MNRSGCFLILLFCSFSTKTHAAPTATGERGSLSAFMVSHGFGGAPMQRRFGNHLFVQTSINSHRTALMVDTGAPVTLIDKNSVRTLGLSAQKTGARIGGVFGMSSERFGVSKLNTLAMGNCTLLNVPVAIADQAGMNYYSRLSHLDGLLGAHEMHKFGVVLDCARQMLYISPNGPSNTVSQQLAMFLTGRGFTRVPMRRNSNYHFEVDGAVNGHLAGFIVDTGSGTTLLRKDTAVKFGVSSAPLRAQSEGPDGRVEKLNSGRVKMLSIGGFEISNAEVTLGNISSELLAGGNIGLLGEEYLSFNFAVLDIGGMALYLRHSDSR